MSASKSLGIYLNDHLAAGTAGIELFKRSLANNEGNEFGDLLSELVPEIEVDRAALVELMEELGIKQTHWKIAGGWMAEKVGRFKLNGQLTGYADLSRLIEFEGMCVGVEAKLSMWRNLKQIEDTDPALAAADLDVLIDKAERQRQLLEDKRKAAAALAFLV